jgi:hypothetical protein
MAVLPTSFSSIKSFHTCPRKHHVEKVLNLIPFTQSEQILYGNYVHEKAERYVGYDEPLPEDLSKLQPALDRLKALPGAKLCEYKMGVTRDMQPVKFFDKSALYRGVADLLVVNDKLAWCVDYKTGSAKYPDKRQLELMAIMTFAHFPSVKVVRGALLFTAAKVLVKSVYNVEDAPAIWAKWCADADLLAAADEHDSWPAKQNGLCKQWCPVTTCEYNGGGAKCSTTLTTKQ